MSSREWTAVLFVVGFLVWAWFAISLSPSLSNFHGRSRRKRRRLCCSCYILQVAASLRAAIAAE